MPVPRRRPHRILAALALLCATSLHLHAQQDTLAPNLIRISGTDPISQITYTRLILTASPTFECTRNPQGLAAFDLLVNFGGMPDTSYHGPWRPTPQFQVKPPIRPTNLTMNFLGYTTVKPFKRQFEVLRDPAGQLRYNPPGIHSSNLEPFSYFVQYLRSLPTLRITDGDHTAQFLTTPLLDHLHSEPLCAATGL